MSGRRAVSRRRREDGGDLPYVDTIRIVASMGVIVLHVAASGVGQLDALGTPEWWVHNVVDSGVRWVVPVFVMLSGALLVKPRGESTGLFYRKRLRRIGLPIVFLTLFYLGWQVLYLDYDWPLGLVKQVAMGSPYYHIYFLYVVAGLYLLTPMLRTFADSSSEQQYLLFVFYCLTAASGEALVRRMLNYRYSAFFKCVPYIGYYCAGYYLRDFVLSRRAILWVCGFFLVSVAAVATGLYLSARTIGLQRALYWYDYLNPLVIVMSLSVFLALASVLDRDLPNWLANGKRIRRLASTTFGVYLIHPMVLDVLNNEGMLKGLGAWGIPLRSATVALVSVLMTLLIQYTPYLRRILG